MAERLYYVVFSNPVSEDRIDEFNKWYDEEHVPQVLATPGLIAAQRIEFRPTQFAAKTAPAHRFGVIYEMEGDPEEVMATVAQRVLSGEIHMIDVIDMDTFAMHFWTPGERVLAADVRANVTASSGARR